MDINTVEHFIANARAGEVLVYHTGFLGIDRGNTILSSRGTLEFVADGEVNDIALAMIDAFDQNKVHLFQRKLGYMKYEYIAMKRSKYARNW